MFRIRERRAARDHALSCPSARSFVDDVNGIGFGIRSADLSDMVGHGTHVASAVAGAGVARVAGVAPRAKIMCLKVADAEGRIFATAAAAAFAYALAMGAHIAVSGFSNPFPGGVPAEAGGACVRLRLAWGGLPLR